MAIFTAKRLSDANAPWFRVSDGDGRSVPSCDDFLLHLRLRDCSVYTQRAYAIGLAHFLSWLLDARREPGKRKPPSHWPLHCRVQSGRGRKARLSRDLQIAREVRERLITDSA